MEKSIGRASYLFFGVVLAGLGIIGIAKGDFPPGWTPVPEWLPGLHALAYLCSIMCSGIGLGLLFGQTRPIAARIFFVWMLVWMVVLRLPWMIAAPTIDHWWPAGSCAVILGTAWILWANFAGEGERPRFGSMVGERGVRIAQMLFGIGVIPFGIAHFLYLDATAPLVPAWLQWPVFWSYFTGAAFIAGGAAIVVGLLPRLAALLLTFEFLGLTIIVWLPRMMAGTMTPFQWGEVVVSVLLTGCGWIVTDSLRTRGWLAWK